MLGPGLFIFFLGRTACFCVKKIQIFPFQGGGGPRLAVCRFLVDCKHSRKAYLSFLKFKIKILKEYFLVLSLFIVWLFPVVRVEVSGEGTCK